MENLDLTVLRTLHGWLAKGQRALLATVVRTWGSSPRPVGSIMALCESAPWQARSQAAASRTA
jgi:xanthine dehydrogenase accessory factor